jgi:AraC family transcriptional regulator of adaptative response / DNA-3-methyladenine glycosylase II
MELDADRCYRAMSSRDARFDGRFFVGVATTGVYCRPICPARTPKAENVRFFACAAAAQEAGFRACKRCRPETAPGTPAWVGSGAVVGRALRLIREGGPTDVEKLAARLGIGGRHLRRLFDEHLGTSPAAVGRAWRAHFARNLLDQTDLPIADVAAAAGFAGARSLQHAINAAFGVPPSALRRASGSGSGISLRLPYRAPLAWDALVGWLTQRAIPGVERVEGGVYRRAVRLGTSIARVEVERAEGNALRLTLGSVESEGLLAIVERARRVFDLDADPDAIATHLSTDPRLAPIVAARPGLRLPGAWDPFETAIRGILGQQVSVAAATTLSGRLAERFGEPIDLGPGLTRLFPRPEVLADVDVGEIGVTRARARTIQVFSQAVASGELALDASLGLDDAVARLCALPGIGPWTASYIAMRALGEPDAFPAADLGLRQATGLGPRELEAVAEAWRPWRGYAAIHLWNSLSGGPDAPRYL